MLDSLREVMAQARSQFPALAGRRIQLNNAAGTEMPRQAIEAMTACARAEWAPEDTPRRRWRPELRARARAATADLLGAQSDEICFTASTTASIALMATALGRLLERPAKILISEASHEANFGSWMALRLQGIEVEVIPLGADTDLDYDWLEKHVDSRTRLIAVGASSNMTGTLHDIARVVEIARRSSALVAVDAAHLMPHVPIDVRELGADVLFVSLYKCYGPHLGAFYVRRDLLQQLPRPTEESLGGATVSAFELGMANFHALAGWLGTLEYLMELGRTAATRRVESNPVDGGGPRSVLTNAMNAISAWESHLTRRAEKLLLAVPGLDLYRRPAAAGQSGLGVFSFNIRGRSPEEVAARLESGGVECGVGHNGAPRTLTRLAGTQSAIRLSLAHYTLEEEIDCAAKLLQ